jgi:hypothetical protein
MMKYRGSKGMAGETRVNGGKSVAGKMNPQQIPHRLACDGTHVSAMRGWQLIF